MAKFDYSSKCVHPNICKRLMTEFLQEAATVTYEAEYTALMGEDENGWPIFGESYSEELPRKVKLTKGRVFCTETESINEEYIEIIYSFKQLARHDDGEIEFGRNIRSRAPFTAGFSTLTLSLLHELGHNETLDDIPDYYDREKALKQTHKHCKGNLRMLNMMYFSLPDEYLATQWAVDWLSDEDNRKKAKQFERDFFKAWRGE